MNRRDILLALAFAGTGAGASLGGVKLRWPFATRAEHPSLLIAGSSTMYALNQAWAAGFFVSHPAVDITIEKGGSLPALIALKRGAIDLAAMERDVTVAEDDMHIRNFLVARSDISIAVNSKLPITSLSTQQIRALLSGAAANWKQVGGPDAPVHVISRVRGSTTRQFVEEIVLDGDDITPTAQELDSTRLLAERVAADPFALGYVSLKDRVGIAKVSYLAVDGIPASRATILSSRYPYTHSLYLVLNSDQQGPAADFVAFVRSAAGQKIVERQNLVPVC